MAPPKSAAALIGRVQKHWKFGTIIVWRGQCKHFKQTISRRAHGTRSSTSSISTEKNRRAAHRYYKSRSRTRLAYEDMTCMYCSVLPQQKFMTEICASLRVFSYLLSTRFNGRLAHVMCVCVLCVFAVISVHIFLLLLSCVCFFCLLCFVFYVCTLKTGPRNVCPFAGCLVSTSKKAFSAPWGLGIWWIQSTKCIFESA